MDNVIIMKNNEYKLEKIWRNKKNDMTLDSKGNIFPYPKQNNTSWGDKDVLLERLEMLNKLLDYKNKYKSYGKNKKCLICKEPDISTKKYIFKHTIWEDGLNHYIEKHNIEPSTQFKKFIFQDVKFKNIDISKEQSRSNTNNKNMILEKIKKNDREYVMIERNQMLILDALMIHGGYTKRYIDDTLNNRYSEHAGLLDFEGNSLSKILVSGKTKRVDEDDNEIFFPMDTDDMLNYEYIFHTHPPTPKPGGRAIDGVLYEFPSMGDIFHFIDHHNDGKIIGSLVVTAEGLYNIRQHIIDVRIKSRKINVNDNEIYKQYNKTWYTLQHDAIKKYGANFTTETFYSKIAQDMDYISILNETLNKFNIHIEA